MASSTETENSILEPSSTAEEIETETTPEAKSRTLKSTNKTSVVKGFKAGATSKGGNKKQKKSKSKKKLGRSSQMNLRFKQQNQQNGADKPKSVVSSTLAQQPPALVVASPSKRVEDVLPGNGRFLKFLKRVENSL